jgi:hypothetical protein
MVKMRAGDVAALVALWLTLPCLSVAYALLHLSTTRMLQGATLPALVTGTAATPFQHRVLIPFVFRKLCELVPELASALQTLTTISEALFHLAAVLAATLYLRRRGASALTATLSALPIALLPFLYFVVPPFRPFFYPSDTASLFFLLACLILASERKWTAFAVLFVLGTVNRETTVLALATAALAAWRAPRDRLGTLTLVACALAFVAIKAALTWAYAGNPGPGSFELNHHGPAAETPHLLFNLRTLVSYPQGPFIVGFALGPLAAAVALGARLRDETFAAFTRVAGLYTLGLFLVANLDELRVFGELFPPLALAMAEQLGGSRSRHVATGEAALAGSG